ncbi:MAG: ribonuclease HII [Acidobacteriota bacterium]
MSVARRSAGWIHERRLSRRGFQAVAGVDEVGRGCLAGPVVAAAVVLDPERHLRGLRDSKQLRPLARARLARRIARRARAAAIGVVGPSEIDRTDILRATLEAMRRAVAALKVRPDHLLVDAVRIPGASIPQRSIVRGDQVSASIAAASILAKVYRDELMHSFHSLYPAYRFDANKGYGTRAHLHALRRFGATPLHRRTFRGVPPETETARLPLPGGR